MALFLPQLIGRRRRRHSAYSGTGSVRQSGRQTARRRRSLAGRRRWDGMEYVGNGKLIGLGPTIIFRPLIPVVRDKIKGIITTIKMNHTEPKIKVCRT